MQVGKSKCKTSMDVHRNFFWETSSTCCLSFSECWRYNVNRRSQNASSFLHQQRSQNDAEMTMPPWNKLANIFRWCFISISTVRNQTEGTVARTSGGWPIPNKIPGCPTVLLHIVIAPCYGNSQKNALRYSSAASPNFFGGKYFGIREQQYLVLGQNHKIS